MRRIETVAGWLNPEELRIAIEGHGYDRLIAGHIERPRAVANHPHGIAADIHLGFPGLGDVDVIILDDGHIEAELIKERPPKILLARIQKRVGRDGLDPL